MKNSDFQQLNIAYIEHDKVWSYCPFHKDTIRPNLSISLLDKYYGKYKCWACPAEGYLTKEQMSKLNLLNSITYKNNEDSLTTRWKQFTESCYDNLQKYPLFKLGLAKELNVSTKSLDTWLVGYDGESFTIPMFREDLSDYNKDKGFCGVQRRFSDGTKRCVSGSHLGLMYPYDYIGDSYCIFICEGFSDGISVWDLGFGSIARPHCRHTDGIEEFFGDILEGIDGVIIIPDNDTVGIEGAEMLQSTLEYDYDCTIFSFNDAKDIRDYIAKVGKQQVKEELLRLL